MNIAEKDGTYLKNAYFKYAIILDIDRQKETASIKLIDTNEIINDVPFFFHCKPDSEQLPNGGLKNGSTAFLTGDKVAVYTKNNNYFIIANLTEKRQCYQIRLVLGDKVYLFDYSFNLQGIEKNNICKKQKIIQYDEIIIFETDRFYPYPCRDRYKIALRHSLEDVFTSCHAYEIVGKKKINVVHAYRKINDPDRVIINIAQYNFSDPNDVKYTLLKSYDIYVRSDHEFYIRCLKGLKVLFEIVPSRFNKTTTLYTCYDLETRHRAFLLSLEKDSLHYECPNATDFSWVNQGENTFSYFQSTFGNFLGLSARRFYGEQDGNILKEVEQKMRKENLETYQYKFNVIKNYGQKQTKDEYNLLFRINQDNVLTWDVIEAKGYTKVKEENSYEKKVILPVNIKRKIFFKEVLTSQSDDPGVSYSNIFQSTVTFYRTVNVEISGTYKEQIDLEGETVAVNEQQYENKTEGWGKKYIEDPMARGEYVPPPDLSNYEYCKKIDFWNYPVPRFHPLMCNGYGRFVRDFFDITASVSQEKKIVIIRANNYIKILKKFENDSNWIDITQTVLDQINNFNFNIDSSFGVIIN